jgi:DegV family protein with EDD domain
MNPYVIFTDTACDIPVDLLNAWGVKYASLTFRFTDEDREYAENDIPSHDFYERMRAGGIAKTSAINTETFRKTFEAELKEGHDILYIGFSSGLSTTYNSGRVAAQELAEKYPERTVITIDSLAASAGFGLLVALAAKKRDEGADLQAMCLTPETTTRRLI